MSADVATVTVFGSPISFSVWPAGWDAFIPESDGSAPRGAFVRSRSSRRILVSSVSSQQHLASPHPLLIPPPSISTGRCFLAALRRTAAFLLSRHFFQRHLASTDGLCSSSCCRLPV